MLASWWSAIWPNLAASLICWVPGVISVHMRLDMHHARIRAELGRRGADRAPSDA